MTLTADPTRHRLSVPPHPARRHARREGAEWGQLVAKAFPTGLMRLDDL
ncbi:MAG: hypothetical protein AAGF91_10105 [Actinomycetota bacterium]